MNYNKNLEMPSSYEVLTTTEMYDIDGGAQIAWEVIKKIGEKLFDIVLEYFTIKGVQYVWDNRTKIWNHFLQGLEPNSRTKASAYYRTFSNAIQP